VTTLHVGNSGPPPLGSNCIRVFYLDQAKQCLAHRDFTPENIRAAVRFYKGHNPQLASIYSRHVSMRGEETLQPLPVPK
jgi:hypothetical protein